MMYDVKLSYTAKEQAEEDIEITTQMPVIPKEGELVGFWNGDDWIICRVSSVIYEFDESNKYLLAEINLID